jgi:hypothetical protein
MNAASESITREELADAMRGLKITPEDENTFYPAVADAIFAAAQRNREPEYEPGEIYQSGDGRRWEFYSDEDGQRGWLLPGQVAKYGFDFPSRPLRRLVPAPSRDAIYATLALGIERENADQLTGRICQLLEGGTS